MAGIGKEDYLETFFLTKRGTKPKEEILDNSHSLLLLFSLWFYRILTSLIFPCDYKF